MTARSGCLGIVAQTDEKRRPGKRSIGMAEINYEIVEELGVLSTASSGWRKELNYISWNEGESKLP